MLTLTYALVALSVEQKKVQSGMSNLQSKMQREKMRGKVADLRVMESLLAQFRQLDEACQLRNIELYVLPAIRSATAEADSLLADIEALASMGRIILKTVGARLRQANAQGTPGTEELCDSLEQYCQLVAKRLAMEELQVLPIAQRVISGDEWFDIAAQFISHESERHPEKFDHTMLGVPTPAQLAKLNQNNGAFQSAPL